MGTIIEATATATAQQRSMAPGALEAVDAAARSCLERADRTAGELDLLINAGVYHDKILSEPAFASLIQEDIGANPRQPPGAGHGTFSFDVSNGACGLLTGIHLVDGMLASGTAKLGMVVASDMDPEPGVSRGFGFPAVGGAVLLSADASRAGFTAFHFATFPEFAELFQGYVDWQEDAGPRARTITAGTSSPSRSPSPTPRGRSSAPSRPPANWRRRRRSTSPRSTSSSPPRRSRASATHWRGDSACPPSGSRRPRMTSRSRTRPRRWWRWTPSDSRRRARRCSSRWARGSQSQPRSTGHDLSVRRQRAQRADVARLQALLAPVETRRAPHRSGPPARATTAGENRGRARGARQRQRPPEHLHDARPTPAPVPRLAALLGAPDAVRSAAAARHRAGDPAGRVAVPLAIRMAAARADRAARGVDARRGRGRGRPFSGRRPSPSVSGRCWPSATSCSRGARSRTRRGAPFRRVSATARRSSCACSSGTTKAWRPRSAHSASNSSRARRAELIGPRPLSPGRRARPTPPRTRASRFPRARRSARW